MAKFKAPSKAMRQSNGSSDNSATESSTPPSDASKRSCTTGSNHNAPAPKRIRVSVEEVPDEEALGLKRDETPEEELGDFLF
jgi:hypothetical protein